MKFSTIHDRCQIVSLVPSSFAGAMSDIEGAKMLEYENQIFLDSFHDDGLLVMAK